MIEPVRKNKSSLIIFALFHTVLNLQHYFHERLCTGYGTSSDTYRFISKVDFISLLNAEQNTRGC